MAQYTLIGSPTSPYVRRLRLYLDQVPYKFDAIKDMYGADDKALSAVNPLKRVPVLLIDGKPLWESRVIYAHLQRALGRRLLTPEEENALSVVDTLQDQLVQMFLLKKFEHPVLPENGYFLRHADRHSRMLAFLRAELTAGRFEAWDYPAISLYCLLDWAKFRAALSAEELNGPLGEFWARAGNRPGVQATDPRV